MDLLIGTSNAGKLGELAELLGDLPLHLVSLKDVGLGGMDVAEDALTLEDNARLKSEAYAKASGLLTLADDTGLYIDAIDGRPGIYPARYGGAELTMAGRRAKVLDELAGVPEEKRTARFANVIAVTDPQTGDTTVVRGECEGHIALMEMDGEGGFGYDPIFIPLGYTVSFSQLSADEKNRVSHRGVSARMIAPFLRGKAAT